MLRQEVARQRLGTKAGLRLLVVLLTFCASCVMWRQSDTRLVRGASTPEIDAVCGREPRVAMTKSVLDAHIGRPFPNLTLVDKHRRVIRLEQLRVGRVAVFLAGGPEPDTIKWMRELEAQKWAPPPGYDRLVIVTSWFGERAFDDLVRGAPSSFLVGWPLEDYLTSVRWYPVMFAVSRDGILEGYWFFEDRGRVPTAALA